jgi:transcriptional regulator with XRE-family HTH domain
MCDCTIFPVIDLPRTGRNIQRLRETAGVTVRDLQAYFGFEYPQAIYNWQHGQCLPTVENLLALARLLHVSMEDLLVYDDQEVLPRFCRYPETCPYNTDSGKYGYTSSRLADKLSASRYFVIWYIVRIHEL